MEKTEVEEEEEVKGKRKGSKKNEIKYMCVYKGETLFFKKSSQLEMILSSRGYLTMSGDIFGCDNWKERTTGI